MIGLLRGLVAVFGLSLILAGGVLWMSRREPQGRLLYQERTTAHNTFYSMREQGGDVRRITTTALDVNPLFWLPDGVHLVVNSISNSYLLNVYTGRLRPLFLNGTGWIEIHSPDGQWLYVSAAQNLQRFNLKTKQLEPVYMQQDFDKAYLWSLDGEWLIFSAVSSTHHETDLYRMRVDGSEIERLTDEAGSKHVMGWSPDGDWLVYQAKDYVAVDDAYYLRRLSWPPTDTAPETLVSSSYFVPLHTWSPDGEWIIFDAGNDLYARQFGAELGPPHQLTDSNQAEIVFGWWEDWLVYANYVGIDLTYKQLKFSPPETPISETLVTLDNPYNIALVGEYLFHAQSQSDSYRLRVGEKGIDLLAWPPAAMITNHTQTGLYFTSPEVFDQTIILYHADLDGSNPKPLVRIHTPYYVLPVDLFQPLNTPFRVWLLWVGGVFFILASGLSRRWLARV